MEHVGAALLMVDRELDPAKIQFEHAFDGKLWTCSGRSWQFDTYIGAPCAFGSFPGCQ